MTDAQRRAKAKYQEKVRMFRVAVYPTEQDILDKLESVEQYTPYIKRLIREDIEREKDRG